MVVRKKKMLGELLIEAGIIDDFQLNSALSYQRNWGGRLGACLIRLGYVSEENLLNFLADQLKLMRVDLGRREISAEVLACLPPQKAREYNVIPVDRKEMQGTIFLLVAMSDPTNLSLIDDLQFMTGCRVRAALASDASIREAVDRCYPPLSGSESLSEKPPECAAALPELSPEILTAPPAAAATTEEKLQRLLRVLVEKGIVTLRDYERLR